MGLERPERVAGTPEARLNLVDDQDATLSANLFGGTLQVPGGQLDNAAVALNRLQDQARELARGGVLNRAVDLCKVGVGVVPEYTAIGVRIGEEMDPSEQGYVVTEATDPGERLSAHRRAVIAVSQRQHVDV